MKQRAGDSVPSAFGFHMGQRIEMEPAGWQGGLAWIAVEHSLFDQLFVYWFPATGVCKVTGVYDVVQPDAYGDAHRDAHERFAGYVESKYGKPSSVLDFLREGSPWEEPRDWLEGLRTSERILASHWIASDGANLPAALDSITVLAGEDAIAVSYEFENYGEALKAAERSIVDQF